MRIQSPSKFPNDNNEPKRNCAAEDHSLTIQNHTACKRERRPYPHTDKNVRSRKKSRIAQRKSPHAKVCPNRKTRKVTQIVLYEEEFARMGKVSTCMREVESMPRIDAQEP